jgi:OOP family OmpA-OmpF porin
VQTSGATLEWLLRPAASDTGIDRKALAGLLVELARNVRPEAGAEPTGVVPIDPRLTQLRTLLVGQELEVLARLQGTVEDPEQLADAISRVLPTAIALATRDARLGPVLAPSLEKATLSSIRSDPRTLVNILYPLMVPAMRKSIGESIDETFQSLNESLKHSLSWRGLRWRWEAWRTGTSFAAVVLKHTLVFQVEHVFLIHRHTGLLIAHVASEDATSQDPQLVSSMLVAIQDFVKDSFAESGQQGLDALRLGELRLWSEPGPFATLVAVIRGNPPEGLHDTLRSVLSRIHTDRPQALESFDGDSSGFADVEAQLSEIVALRQKAAQRGRKGFPWLVALVALLLVSVAGVFGFRWWQAQHAWQGYVALLRAQPGIVITEVGREDGKFVVAGLRDPLAADPQRLLRETRVDPARVVMRWEPYQGFNPQFVLQRLRAALDPPPSVTLAVVGDHIVATGSAPSTWLQRARTTARLQPAGAPLFDLSQVRDIYDGAMGKLRDAIQSVEIRFNNNEPLPSPGQEQLLDQQAAKLKELADLSSTMRVAARVTLTGHSDATGRDTFNLSLSMARAAAVVELLKKRGVDPEMLAIRGAGPLEPREVEASDAARSANRRVSFTVGVEDQP